MANYQLAQLDEIKPGECPCGITRRAFAETQTGQASIHLVEIRNAAQTHYHRKLTELYLILEGEGQMELDGRLFPIKPLSAVLIQPGCRHRALGNLKVINFVIPAFDPADEWFD